MSLQRRLATAHAHMRQGSAETALALYLEILQAWPDHALANFGAGMARLAQPDAAAAARHFERATAASPDLVPAWLNLGVSLSRLERYDEAIAAFRAGIERNHAAPTKIGNSELAVAYVNLANIYNLVQADGEAEKCFREALALSPADVAAHHFLGLLYLRQDRLDESRECFRRAIAIEPRHADAHRLLALAKTHVRRDDELRAMEALFAAGQAGQRDRKRLAFGLGKAYEDLGEYDKAFGCWQAGADAHRILYGYDIEADILLLHAARAAFPANYVAREANERVPPVTPVFIVTLPRSGSTLVEQILASHTDVCGGGETGWLRRLAESAVDHPPRDLARLRRRDWARLANEYLRQAAGLIGNESCFTDKSLDNYLWLGMARMMFPNARYVYCQRDPMALGLSCFKNFFAGDRLGWTYDLRDIGRYYRAFEHLMRYWCDSLPGRIHGLCYERLVREPEAEIRKLLAACGLQFEAACLQPQRSRRTVRTASTKQIRQPIHAGHLDEWRRFERALEPLRTSLAGDAGPR